LVNASLASLGLYGITGLSNFVLADEPKPAELDEVTKFLTGGKTHLPYITITDDGPMYPPTQIPWLSDFTSIGGPDKRPDGRLMYLFGRILDGRGRPLQNAEVEIWQTDDHGRYKHPRSPGQDALDLNFGYFGKVKTARDGTYLFKTIVPRSYSAFGIDRAPHVHLKMRHVDQGVLTTEVYFEDKEDARLREKDLIWQGRPRQMRDRMVVPKQSPKKFDDLNLKFEPDAVCCQYDLAFLLP
jgi:protocatechuate 3,4-dioxygenase beta subunit